MGLNKVSRVSTWNRVEPVVKTSISSIRKITFFLRVFVLEVAVPVAQRVHQKLGETQQPRYCGSLAKLVIIAFLSWRSLPNLPISQLHNRCRLKPSILLTCLSAMVPNVYFPHNSSKTLGFSNYFDETFVTKAAPRNYNE